MDMRSCRSIGRRASRGKHKNASFCDVAKLHRYYLRTINRSDSTCLFDFAAVLRRPKHAVSGPGLWFGTPTMWSGITAFIASAWSVKWMEFTTD